MKKFDIKDTLEYKWITHQIKLNLVILLIIFFIFIFSSLFIILPNDKGVNVTEIFGIILSAGFIPLLLVFSFIIIFYYFKIIHLKRGKEKFLLCEVKLDNPSTSYWYRGAVYYTVKVNINGNCISVDTNPLFSSAVFSILDLKDYNNEVVYVWYDEQLDKVYIIDKVK